MTSPAEKELGKIRKLRENMTCADCATQSQFGFTAVVMKVQGRQVGSFVCNHCKSAHQSFSHAVKSVTMSNWDMSEVHTLRARNGGGNDAVRATWLGGAPPGPGQGAPVEMHKAFVHAAYVQRQWWRVELVGECSQKCDAVCDQASGVDRSSSLRDSRMLRQRN